MKHSGRGAPTAVTHVEPTPHPIPHASRTLPWDPPTPRFILQASPTLMPPAWTTAPSGATNPATVPASLPTTFYRLNKP